MAKASKSRKKRRRSSGGSGGGRRSGGGSLTGMRSGMKGFVGLGPRRKESTLSRVLTWVLLAAAIALLVWRFTR